MQGLDLLRFNLRLISRQWFRTLMVLLATAVGVAAVLLLTGLGEGARRFVLSEFALLGNDVLIVLPGRKETSGGLPPLTGEGARDLTLEDAEAINRLSGVKDVAPLVVGLTTVTAHGLNREQMVVGTTESFFNVRGLNVQQGQLLPKLDLQRPEPVCVIGTRVWKEIFAGRPVLGQWLRTGERRYRIIGVLEEKGVGLGTDMRDVVIVPVASAMQLFNTSGLFRLFIKLQHPSQVEQVTTRVEQLIQQRHGGELDITVITQDAVLGVFNNILQILTLAVGAIAAISLIVAGILIMNIMLISVSQRTSEIGLLKALGASASVIRLIFLSEALLLSLLGVLLGIAIGFSLLWLGHSIWPEFPVAVPLWALFGALFLALFVAGLFAWLPASKAASLPPVLALRGETSDV